MRVFLTPIQDASVYDEFPDRNTGLDEIIECGKTNNGINIVRSLIQFDLSSLSVPFSASYDLILRVANADTLKANQGVQICQLSQSWQEGTGYFFQDIVSTSDGVTWNQRYSGSFWPTGSLGGQSGSLTLTSSIAVPVTDLTFDVSTMVRSWISGSPNYGFLVQFPVTDEVDPINMGNIKFFSKDTHTIYPPTLVAKWNDQVYITGSSPWPTSDLIAIPSSLKTDYAQGETVKVNISVRERYPLKTFATTGSMYSGLKYLPSSSYYSIVDDQTGTVIIPFSNESSISANGNQSCFTFKIQNMYPLRYYRVLLRVVHDGLDEIFDNNSIFRVR